MKIKDFRTYIICAERNYVLIKIITDQGLYGVGDATLNGRELIVYSLLKDYLGPWLIGKDAENIEDIWQTIYRSSYWRGGPVLMTALSAIDTALWDIKAKQANLPLYSLLGGKSREKVTAYFHCHGTNLPDLVENCQNKIKNLACKALRISIDLKTSDGVVITQPSQDYDKYSSIQSNRIQLDQYWMWDTKTYLNQMPAIFETLRQKLGDDIELVHDVHGRLTPIEAARLCKELEPYHLYFLEDPIRPENPESVRIIRQHSTTPLGIGELYLHKWECLKLISNQLIDFIRVDLAHCGGITEARKIASVAETYFVRTSFHGPSDVSPIVHAVNIHLDMALHNSGIQEYVFHSSEIKKVIQGGPTYQDGYILINDDPGLGVDIDESKIEDYKFNISSMPTLRNLDGSVHDW
jgi:mannonate dehydratase